MWKPGAKNKFRLSWITLITYLSDISFMNLIHIWVFSMPPILQRRQEHLSIKLLAARGKKMFPSLSSISFHPVKNGLRFGGWSTRIVCLSAEWMLTIWVSQLTCTIITKFFIQPTRKTYKSAIGDAYILGTWTMIQSRMLISLIISKSQERWLEATDRGIIWYVIIWERQFAAMFFYTSHRSNIIDHQSQNSQFSLINIDDNDWEIMLMQLMW